MLNAMDVGIGSFGGLLSRWCGLGHEQQAGQAKFPWHLHHAHGGLALAALAPALFLVVIGMYVVNFWLSGQARSRKKAMTRGLPDTMDLGFADQTTVIEASVNTNPRHVS